MELFISAIINLDVFQISDYLHSGSPSHSLQRWLFTLKMTHKIWPSQWPPDPLMAEVKMASQFIQRDVISKHGDISFSMHEAKAVIYCKLSGLYNSTGGISIMGVALLDKYKPPMKEYVLPRL